MKVKIDEKFLQKIDPMGQLKDMKPARIIKKDWMGTVVLFQGNFGKSRQIILPNSAVTVEA